MVEAETGAAQLWNFALGVYLPETARAAFLRLQDGDGADVPLLLFVLWCGSEGVRLSDEAMVEAVAFSRKWRTDRVEPLRRLRQAWKGAPDALTEAARQEVAKAEQAVERLQMDRLAEFRSGEEGASDALIDNLAALSRYADLSFDATDIDIICAHTIAFARKQA